MIYDKSGIQRHEYKVVKRSRTKYEHGKPKSDVVYLVYRRIRWFGIWFWWNFNFNYNSWDAVNYNTKEFERLYDAKKHIQWCINLHRDGTTIIFEDEEISDLDMNNFKTIKDPWNPNA